MRIRLFLLAFTFPSWACTSPEPQAASTPNWQRTPVSIELRLAKLTPAAGFTSEAVHGEDDTVYVSASAVLSNPHIARVEPGEQPDALYLSVWLTEQGMDRFDQLMTKHVGEHLAVLINSVVIGPPPTIAPPPEGMVESLRPDPQIPLTVSLHLPPEQWQQLAKAVRQTWPTPAAP